MKNKIPKLLKAMIVTSISLMIYNYLYLIVYHFMSNKINQETKYSFTCYKRNIVVKSSYGYQYNPNEMEVFDAREQKVTNLPNNCSFFKE